MYNTQFEKALALGGLICGVFFFAAFVGAGLIPVPGPLTPVDGVAEHFRDHVTGARIGMVLLLLASPLYAGFVAVGAAVTNRIEGVSKAAIYSQLVGGALASVTIMMPAIFFIVATFRVDRDPDLIYLMNDLAFVMIVIPWMPFLLQNWAFAAAIFSDKVNPPLLPRWLAYLNIWAPIVYSPASLIPFLKSGPFAWNGVLVFYIPGGIFFIWFVIMALQLNKAVGPSMQREISTNRASAPA